ncbi:type III-B CRISPR module RAMP protein Cmr4 [Thiorhodospira sibirica]|uniref:type III-B CRISPR module RAMP protein Cmr4 n=1 Tax=Thiorhodospira sibirica TaxID=154347 RepID=UPI00022C5882|nr:type III-B CRISPR module RAMP protein Cmr4 [Thiorhodospira sibirica]
MTFIAHQVLGLTCETPLHAGGGGKEAVIDLPIQREAHTGWPCVYGSSMKGALRARAELLPLDNTLIVQAFGPDTENASEHAGALLVSDARLLLLPVRSLTTHFKWVTCPALLRRLLMDLARAELGGVSLTLPKVEAGTALGFIDRPLDDLYLEEFRFAYKEWPGMDAWVSVLQRFDAPVAGIDVQTQREVLKEQLVLVDDDSFSHLCRSALPVLPHIRINSATKTVAAGALWYEENLPAETMLYTVLSAQPSRKPEHPMEAKVLLDTLTEQLFATPYVQIGGNETTGMGWCRVARVHAEG